MILSRNLRHERPAASGPAAAPARRLVLACLVVGVVCGSASAQVAIRGKKVHTMAGPVLEDGMVIVENGKISAIGRADQIRVPEGYRVLEAAVVTPGLIDARATVGLTGIYNEDHDQDQLESSAAIQPELRALDAFNIREPLVDWVRGFGITTVHTGHGPGELISGQTMVVKTAGDTVETATLVESRALAATLADSAQKGEGKSPGTRGKMMAMLREQFIKAREYQAKIDRAAAAGDPAPPRDLKLETLSRALRGELPLLITANRAQDIANALRLAKEFNLKLWLDSAAEAYLLLDEIKAAGVPVVIHPAMQRAYGDTANQSFETAGKLARAGVTVVSQSGFESYVPKTRVVLFEAALHAAHGLGAEAALRSITIDAARLLGVEKRVGSLEVGKDGDLALYDGDPFEYTTHCVGVVIDGKVVSEDPR